MEYVSMHVLYKDLHFKQTHYILVIYIGNDHVHIVLCE